MPGAMTLKLFSIDIHAARFRLAQPHEQWTLTLLTSQGRQVDEGLAALSRWPPRRHRIVFSEIVTHSEIATVTIAEVHTPCVAMTSPKLAGPEQAAVGVRCSCIHFDVFKEVFRGVTRCLM
jgi:hypothetical protein